MSVHLKLSIEPEEYSALLKLALSEMRNPESQLRFFLRKELCDLGLIKSGEDNKLEESIKASNAQIDKEKNDEK